MNPKNPFFRIALDRASKLAGKPGRLANLLVQLALKLRGTAWKDASASAIREKFYLLGRMTQAHLGGRYKVRSLRILVMLLAVIIYFINPFDLVPDVLLGVGLADDFAVLTWFFSAASGEVTAFAEWERAQVVA